MLGLLGLGAVGTVTGSTLQSRLSAVMAPLELRDPTGLLALLPIGNAFRYYSVTGGAPTRTAQSYRLDVTGLVDSPASWTLADLQAMPQTSIVRDFQCVTGWRVPEVHWSGVKLSAVLGAGRAAAVSHRRPG